MMNGKRQQIISASLLINELCDEDIEKRITAVSSLKTIGTALGTNRIKNQLIPFLKEQLLDDESKVLISLLNNILSLGQIMGGGLSYTYLFGILEETLQNQEEKVRIKAIETYCEALQKCNIQKFENQVMNSLKNILNFDFNEGKEGFFAIVSGKLGKFSAPNQQFLLSQYQSMAEGTVFPLRKFAAAYSKKLAQWLSENEAGILKIVEILFKDKQQSNKIFLIDTIIAVAKFKNHTFLQPYFNLISYQFTWRIRYQLISKVDILAEALGSVDKFKPFLTYFIKYINDIEPQIRSISCLKLQSITNFVSPDDIVNRIIPALKNIPQDSNIYVRNSLASSILSLCNPLGKKNTSELILPKFLQLLKDDEVQVRLTMFSKIDQICSVLGTQTLSQTTVPALHELATSPNWRIRVSSMDMLFYFIKKSGVQFMNEKNFKLIMDYINDKANAVRKECIKLIVKIQQQLGTNWIEKHFLQKVLHLHKAKSYIQRQTFLDIINALIPGFSDDCCNKQITPIVLNILSSDTIENVRISVCMVLKTLYKRNIPEKQAIKKQLKVLSEDKDKDVKEMALKTLKNIDG